jgi:outer membrane immunogenic protein
MRKILLSTVALAALTGFAGYNYQFANKFVVGVEGEVNGVFSGSKSQTLLGTTWSDKQGLDSVVRGRLGYAVDRALFYVAGGVAFENLSSSFAAPAVTSLKANSVGWTIGGGVDYAFTNNWIGRVEYRYTDYGAKTYASESIGAPVATTYTGVPLRNSENAILVGIAYKFGAPEAVVAKY